MKKIKIGLIGSGFMGRCHAHAYKTVNGLFDLPFQPVLQMLADQTPEKAKHAAQALQFEQSTANWQELVENPQVDMVDICTPNHLHKPLAMAAIEAGKLVYCEKPLACSLPDAQAMMQAAESAQIATLVGYNYLQNPVVQTAREIIQSGEIGEVIGFRGIHAEDYMADRNLPFNDRLDPESGGGVLADLGSHIIVLARFLVGPLVAVQGMMETVYPQRPKARGAAESHEIRVEDQVRFLARFATGCGGSLEASWVAAGRKLQLAAEITGTLGTLVFNHERLNELYLYEATQTPAREGFKTILTSPAHSGYGNFCPAPGHQLGFNDLKVLEIARFLKAYGLGEKTWPDFREGWEVQKVLEAVKKSAQEERWVSLAEMEAVK